MAAPKPPSRPFVLVYPEHATAEARRARAAEADGADDDSAAPRPEGRPGGDLARAARL